MSTPDDIREMREIYIELLKESRGVPDGIARSIDPTAVSRYLGYNKLEVRNIFDPKYHRDSELSEGEVERMIADLNAKAKKLDFSSQQ